MKLQVHIIPAINGNRDLLVSSEKGLSIKGQVKEKSISIPCRVRLHEKASGRIIDDVQTDSNGFFKFDHLNLFRFYAVAYHPTNQHNTLIFDDLIPK